MFPYIHAFKTCIKNILEHPELIVTTVEENFLSTYDNAYIEEEARFFYEDAGFQLPTLLKEFHCFPAPKKGFLTKK